MTIRRIIVSALLYLLIAVLVAALAVGNVLAFTNFGLVSQFLQQETYRIEKVDDESFDADYYKSEFSDTAAMKAAQEAFAEDAQAEGTVLLQNANLPLAAGGKVTLLGSSSSSGFLYGGGGSGAVSASDTDLKSAFEDAGYEVNPVMWEFYTNEEGRNYRNETTNTTVGEPMVESYTAEQLDSFEEYADAAIVVIGRRGQENSDIGRTTTEDASRHMLEFSQAELELIDTAVRYFDDVVILLNTASPMEIGYLAGLDVSVLWIGFGGEYGVHAIPEILNGTRYPSGRLTDTYAYDALSAPAMQNFGNFSFTNEVANRANSYYVYAEGIYVGYRYYETRYADVVTGRQNVGEYDYSATVQYPFGYGLSYTEFEYSDFSMQRENDDFLFSVTVTNTGDAAGKEVVELYLQAPYTEYDIEHGIERSAIQLVGFAKTQELQPGDSATVQLTVPYESLRTYDSQGAGTYIVEDGEYWFAVGADAHAGLNNILSAQGYGVSDGMTAEGDGALALSYRQEEFDAETFSVGVDGYEIENRFDRADIRTFDGSFTYLSRNDWVGTFPEPYGGEDRSMEATDEMLQDMENVYPTDASAEMPALGQENGLTLASVIGQPYESAVWEQLLDQLTARDMMRLVGQSGYGSVRIDSINKPPCIDKDGPAGISSTLVGGVGCFAYPGEILMGATWNVDLLTRLGELVGEDSIHSGVAGWYAPAMNIHRTPFSGRNFEYYSEDGYLNGVLAAAELQGTAEKGLYCYIKHFVLNDQETNRLNACTFADEQTIRELYLLPFELSVREGHANGLMVAMNRIGCVWTGAHSGLLNDVLRGEWGFVGMVITDTASSYDASMDLRAGLPAGTDMMLCATSGIWDIPNYESDAYILQLMRESCHRILYVIANSNAMNGIAPTDIVVPVTPAWVWWIVALDSAVGIGAVVGIVFITRGLLKAKKRAASANQ